MRGGASRRRKARVPQPPLRGGCEVVPTRAPGGWWSAAGAARDAGIKARARRCQDRVLYLRLCEKKAARLACATVSRRRSIYGAGAGVRTISTRPNTISVCPGLTGLEHGQTAGSAPQGLGVTTAWAGGTVESGRPPTDGPVRSDRKEPRSSRVTSSLRDYVPLREERYSCFRNRNRDYI